MDLRTGRCFPYLPVASQGSDQACVAHAFATALYCLKAGSGLLELPISGVAQPSVASLFEPALSESPDPSRGVSVEAVLRELQRRYGEDLRQLGWRPRTLGNEVAAVRRCLQQGGPVVLGYQVNEAILRFHEDPEECRRCGFLLPDFRRDPKPLSGHAVLVVGYDDRLRTFLVRNSWGEAWGVDGHFLLRYEQLADEEAVTHVVGFVR